MNASDLAQAALYNNGTSMKLRNVHLVSQGVTTSASGWNTGVWNGGVGAWLELDSVSATGEDTTGVCFGLRNLDGAFVSIQNSSFYGQNCSIPQGLSAQGGGIVNLHTSQVFGQSSTGAIGPIAISANANTAGDITSINVHNTELYGRVLSGTPGEGGISSVRIAGTQVFGNIENGSVTATLKCVHAYDQTFAALGTDCELP